MVLLLFLSIQRLGKEQELQMIFTAVETNQTGLCCAVDMCKYWDWRDGNTNPWVQWQLLLNIFLGGAANQRRPEIDRNAAIHPPSRVGDGQEGGDQRPPYL